MAILLGSDGRHVLLGRRGEPGTAELAEIAAKLAASGLGGWVARMTGDYWHQARCVRLEMIREALPSPVTFEDAEAAFEARRQGNVPPA